MFSPYYAFGRRRGRSDPENHCSLNVALYGKSGHRWSMTERGSRSIARNESSFIIGPSSMRWEEGVLVIDIDEVTVPVPTRLRGQVRLTPSAICAHEVRLDLRGQHMWRPVAPRSHVEVNFEKPGLQWSGAGYHDSNWGEVPLEDSFDSWVWSRTATKDGAAIIYDTVMRDGSTRAFALDVDGSGNVRDLSVPSRQEMPTTFWRMRRHTLSYSAVKEVSLLEDSPFYARTLLRVQIDDEVCMAFHESLSLGRFRNPVVQMMLPFRMPRRA